ncbi:MAG: septum formation initiator family protein [Deltaproteobacteria bacterium]|nr:septum formation initiator family protein [Candidatus Anaeroferrophillus wilburensis]MBN2889881.1 septum formation initiator family protein [Deltaproteobacteria bacterium]
MKQLIPLLLLSLCCAFLGFAVFGDNGFLHLSMMKREIASIELSAKELKAENERLKRTVLLLQDDVRYQELAARTELGMVRENEQVFIFR